MSDAREGLFTGPADLLKVVPITTFSGQTYYDPIHMRATAYQIYAMRWPGEKPPFREFSTQFCEELKPWLPVTDKGKMGRRIINYMFKTYQMKIGTAEAEHIGKYLAASIPAGGWTFDITNRLDWRPGDFGDHDACFLISRRDVLGAMMEEGVHAIRFYRAEDNGGDDHFLGQGRAWISPTAHGPIVFNAYGTDLTLVRMRISQLLPDVPQKSVGLTNLGSAYGHVYINNGQGILVGEAAKPDSAVDHIDLTVYTGSQRPIICYGCGARTPRHQTYNVIDDEGEDARVCETCYHTLFDVDYASGSFYRKTRMIEMECVRAGRVSANGYYYEGEIIKVTTLPANINSRYLTCEKCGRLTDGRLYISQGGEAHHWCFLCGQDAPLECRDCSYYLPEGETQCRCGSKILRSRMP